MTILLLILAAFGAWFLLVALLASVVLAVEMRRYNKLAHDDSAVDGHPRYQSRRDDTRGLTYRGRDAVGASGRGNFDGRRWS